MVSMLFHVCMIMYRIGSGNWAAAGVATEDIRVTGNLTAVQCSSEHLTSFAVLVDVAGGLRVSCVRWLWHNSNLMA